MNVYYLHPEDNKLVKIKRCNIKYLNEYIINHLLQIKDNINNEYIDTIDILTKIIKINGNMYGALQLYKNNLRLMIYCLKEYDIYHIKEFMNEILEMELLDDVRDLYFAHQQKYLFSKTPFEMLKNIKIPLTSQKNLIDFF